MAGAQSGTRPTGRMRRQLRGGGISQFSLFFANSLKVTSKLARDSFTAPLHTPNVAGKFPEPDNDLVLRHTNLEYPCVKIGHRQAGIVKVGTRGNGAPAVLKVQILSLAPDGFPPQGIGYSLPCAGQGFQVTLFADRVEAVSRTTRTSFCRVLAYALAHVIKTRDTEQRPHDTAPLQIGTLFRR